MVLLYLGLLLLGGCIAWKIFWAAMAAMAGLRRACHEIPGSCPRLVGKARHSLLAGVLAGAINGILTGGNVAISAVSAAGVALVTFGCDLFNA